MSCNKGCDDFGKICETLPKCWDVIRLFVGVGIYDRVNVYIKNGDREQIVSANIANDGYITIYSVRLPKGFLSHSEGSPWKIFLKDSNGKDVCIKRCCNESVKGFVFEVSRTGFIDTFYFNKPCVSISLHCVETIEIPGATDCIETIDLPSKCELQKDCIETIEVPLI